MVEDSVQVAPEVKDEDFLMDVRKHESQEINRVRNDHARKLVANAEWKDAEKKAAE